MKPKFHKKGKQARGCGTLSQICTIMLILLVIFYVTVASYLTSSPSKYRHDDNFSNAASRSSHSEFIQVIPNMPNLESFTIPKIPKQQTEDEKYAPPQFDRQQHEKYAKLHQNAQSQSEHEKLQQELKEKGDIPSIVLPRNDYSDLEGIEEQYASQCPEKFPKKVPSINDFPFICANLKEFDIRYHEQCTLETCNECVPPAAKRMHTENGQTSSWQTQFEEQKESRRSNIKSMISHLRPKLDGPVILMVFNHGYAWLFYNLLCSLEFNGIDIRHRTIIVTTDRQSQELVEATGFNAHYPEWLGKNILSGITSKAAASFALGAHKWIVSIQIALITDLIDMGYDVIMQDIDMIWYKSPLPYLMDARFRNIDIQMSVDGTMGMRGPGNSGFFIVRSNCKMKLFMNTMVSLIGLIMTGRSDQMLWNSLLQEKLFRMINFETLSTQHFISGFQVNLAHQTKRRDLPTDHFIVHASWTTDQWDKIEKFYNIEHWYFTEEKCPQWYNFSYLPDLAERKWHIRDKTQEQEQKFKELGLFRDSTNGVYEKHS